MPQDRGLEQLIGRTTFADPSDSLVLEDESARVQLRGEALPVAELVTGVVAAVRGSASPSGDFMVTVIPLPCLPPLPSKQAFAWTLQQNGKVLVRIC